MDENWTDINSKQPLVNKLQIQIKHKYNID